MALNSNILKNDLKTSIKTDLIALGHQCKDGSGLNEEEYAEQFSDILAGHIAQKVIDHFKSNGVVTVTDPVSGPLTGGIT